MSPIQTWDLWAEAWLGLQPFLFLMLISAIIALIISTPTERTGPLFGVGLAFGAIGLALGLFSGLSELATATGALAGATGIIIGFVAVALRKPKDDAAQQSMMTAMFSTPLQTKDAQGQTRQATDSNGMPLREMSERKVLLGVTLLMFTMVFGMFWGQGIAGIRAAQKTQDTAVAVEVAAQAEADRTAAKTRLDAELAEAAAVAKAQREAETGSNVSE